MKKKWSKELSAAAKFICTAEFWRMAVFWSMSLVLSYFHLFFRRPRPPFPRCPMAETAIPTAKPICIITGATSGLGAATALELSREGFHVVLIGRSVEMLSKTMQHIEEQNKGAQLKGFLVEISSMESVMKFKDSLERWFLESGVHSSVQLLINNAGILSTSYRQTSECFDQVIGTNYIGAFYLTKLLLPLLRNSPTPSRIVNVTSFTHRTVFNVDVSKMTVEGKCFSKFKQYPCARTYELSKCKAQSRAVDPGAVRTNLLREIPLCLSDFAFTTLKLLGLLQTPECGSRSIIDAALAPEETSGLYFFGGNGRSISLTALSRDITLAERLWSVTNDLVEERSDKNGTP